MFEFSGILCRHILAVFRVTNVLTLPSHYLLKRWTRTAKSGMVLHNHALGLPCDYQESSTACRDILCREAIKYVEEGAKSICLYNVAMEALREAAKKVVAAKQNGPSVIQSNLANRSDQEVNNLAKRSDQEVRISENEMGQLRSCSVVSSFLIKDFHLA